MIFKDRQDAGRKLAEKLLKYQKRPDVAVLGLPRGGVVTAHEIAKQLQVPLDIVVPRKIGAPGNPEFAIGAITEDGEGVFHKEILQAYHISPEYIKKQIQLEQKEARRRLKRYRGNRPPFNLENKIVILVDDGIATGATMEAAIQSAHHKKAKKIIVAVPVIAPDTFLLLKDQADEIIVLDVPSFFTAVGQFYQNFPQTTDEEVLRLLGTSGA